jgi:hypothetical protein
MIVVCSHGCKSRGKDEKIALNTNKPFHTKQKARKKPIGNPISSSKMSLLLVLYLDPLDKQRNEFFK